jgi:hypothetical protein
MCLICRQPHIREVPGLNLDLETSYPDWGFRYFTQSFEVNAGIVLKLGHDRFLSRPFQFTLYLLPIHSTLYNLSYWEASRNKLQAQSIQIVYSLFSIWIFNTLQPRFQKLAIFFLHVSFISPSYHQYSAWPQTGRPRFYLRLRRRIFLVASVSRPAVGPTQPPVQGVPWSFLQG